MLYADFKFRRALYNVVYCAQFRSFQSLLYFACLQELKYRFKTSRNLTLLKETREVNSIENKKFVVVCQRYRQILSAFLLAFNRQIFLFSCLGGFFPGIWRPFWDITIFITTWNQKLFTLWDWSHAELALGFLSWKSFRAIY